MNYSFYNEMDELDDILNESTDEEIFIESMEELFEEKASQLEYNIRRFKEKYNFNPKDSTIVVDGHKYRVDMKIKDPLTYIPADGDGADDFVFTADRSNGAAAVSNGKTVNSTPIILSKNFFMLKDDKRRAAVLQHEIGHLKLHSTIAGSAHTDRKKVTSQIINDDIRRNVANRKDYITDSDGPQSKDEMRKKLNEYKFMDNALKERKNRANEIEGTLKEQHDRNKARQAAKKYEPRKDDPNRAEHANAKEFEADRYAANKVGERYMKRGLREVYKKDRSDERKEDPVKTRAAIRTGLQVEDDINIFNKADKNNDKQIRQAIGKTYKQSIADIKSENSEEQRKRQQAPKEEQHKYLQSQKAERERKIKDNAQSHRKQQTDYNQRSKALKDKELRNNPSLK